ncbi:MAG: response regulator [Candidatus Marinimicrobia bacterium]|nr:response regulator [Candidatus Neomarinimicrobiota bacterium]
MPDPKPKLLVVEDDISSQQYYDIILSDLYDLTMVATVEKAKQALDETEFSLAIIDISLPGDEDGIDLIKFLVNEHPQKLPALAISAHAFPQNREEAMAGGAVKYFTKPIMSGVLLEAVQEYIL